MNSIRLGSKDTLQRPDGTIKEGPGEVGKGPSHIETEKCGDDIIVGLQRPDLMQGCGVRSGVELSDDTLV